MLFIDTHCHFDFPFFTDDLPRHKANAAQAGLTDIIIPSVSHWNIETVTTLCRTSADALPHLHAALGLHPLYIAEHTQAHLEQLETLIMQAGTECVAVGEIGLDRYMASPQWEKQLEFFIAQLQLAVRADRPVILHSRKTHDTLAAILRRHPVPRRGVVHGFSGSFAQAQAFVKLGYYIGVGGTITYERAQKTRKAIAQLPLTALLLETDAPDMPLSGFQGEPNRPERIVSTFQVLCSLREESPDEIAAQIYHNSRRLFSL
ncbi:MAG: TatD family hydrolase [Morganella sp. (in: enterobacteria)]